MANVYHYNWQGKRTGFDYKLIIKPSHIIDDVETIVDLEAGVLTFSDMGYEYDLYALGNASTMMLKIEYNLRRIPIELYNSLMEPFYDYDYDYDLSDDDVTFLNGTYLPLEFKVGIYYELQVKFNGRTQAAGAVYQTVFEGTEKLGLKKSIKDNIYGVTVSEISRVVTENFKTIYLEKLWWDYTANRKTTEFLIEYWPKDYNVAWAYRAPDIPEHNIYMYDLGRISEYIDQVATEIYRKQKRDSSALFEVSLPVPTYYKTDQTGAGLKGASITLKSDMWVPCFLVKFGEPTFIEDTGFLGGGLASGYENLWDVIGDWYKGNMKKAFVEYNFNGTSATRINTVNIQDVIGAISIDKLAFLEKPEFLPFADILQRANVKRTDAQNNDISDYQLVNPSSRAEQSYTVTLINHNICGYFDQDLYTKDPFINYNPNFNYGKIYYIDGDGDFIGAHDHCLYDLGYGDSDDYVTFDPIIIADKLDIKYVPLRTQKESGAGNILVETMLKLYSNENQCKIIGKMFFDNMADNMLSEPLTITNPFLAPHNFTYMFDPSELGLADNIYDRFHSGANDFTYFYIVKCSIDLIEETVDVELINVGDD